MSIDKVLAEAKPNERLIDLVAPEVSANGLDGKTVTDLRTILKEKVKDSKGRSQMTNGCYWLEEVAGDCRLGAITVKTIERIESAMKRKNHGEVYIYQIKHGIEKAIAIAKGVEWGKSKSEASETMGLRHSRARLEDVIGYLKRNFMGRYVELALSLAKEIKELPHGEVHVFQPKKDATMTKGEISSLLLTLKRQFKELGLVQFGIKYVKAQSAFMIWHLSDFNPTKKEGKK